MDEIRAVVQKIIPSGQHGPYAVATADDLKGSVTFSLEPTVWQEQDWPEAGSVVLLSKIRQKRAGWRAKAGRFTKLSDEYSAKSNTMTQQIITEKTFKPFVIESQRQHRTLFRVVECSGGVRRDQLEPLLEQLPIRFQLRQRLTGDDVREPLDVYVSGPIVEIYPPRDRILVGSSIESWGAVELTRHMKMDNIADMTSVYCRQIRSCVHFSPQIFGVVDWPDLSDGEIEVDIFAYPKGIENYLQPVAPIFDSFQVKDLLGLIAGGKDLTVSRVQKWRSLIMYAVLSMRSCYDRPELASYPVSQYYSENWRRIDAAQDDEELTRALESLVTAITWK